MRACTARTRVEVRADARARVAVRFIGARTPHVHQHAEAAASWPMGDGKQQRAGAVHSERKTDKQLRCCAPNSAQQWPASPCGPWILSDRHP